jgi:MerR family transcriptional regulator, light-induced transcriptional regulator
LLRSTNHVRQTLPLFALGFFCQHLLTTLAGKRLLAAMALIGWFGLKKLELGRSSAFGAVWPLSKLKRGGGKCMNANVDAKTPRPSTAVAVDQTKKKTLQAEMNKPHAKGALATLVEAQIIPRLLAAARPPAPARSRARSSEIAPHDVAEFTELIIADNRLAIATSIDLWRAKGVSVETLYLDLLAASARQLGLLWGEDECNFCEVSLGVWRLQEVIYELRPAFFAERAPTAPTGYRVLLAPLALEQHTMGVMLMAEFFRRAGWDVSSELPTDNRVLMDAVASEHIDLVGISVADLDVFAVLSKTIAELRRVSKNPRITVMVGGWAFQDDPAKAIALGADFSVPDVRDAVVRGESYVARAWQNAPDRAHR